MIIRCPQCDSTYEIAGSTQVLGKKVRCTNCTHVWRVEAVEENPRAVVPEPEITEADADFAQEGAEAEASGDSSPDPGEDHDQLAAQNADAGPDDGDRPWEDPSEGDGAQAEPAPMAPERPNATLRREPAGWHQTAAPPLAPAAPTTARPSRQRPDRYSLDPFDETKPVAGSAPAAGAGASSTPFSDLGANWSAAERRIERERSYTNGHAALANGPSRQPTDPVRTNPRQVDASWDRGSQLDGETDYDPQDRPVREQANDFAEPALPGRGSRMGVVLGWLALVAVLTGGAMFGLFGRETVVQVLPGAAPVYASLGMPVNRRGLEFRDVTYVWTVDGKGRPAIDVAGEIENVSAAPVMVPTVVFAFQDEEGLELFHWATPVRRSPLPPGKRSKFQARIPAPPEAVRNLQLRFARAR